MTNRPPGPGPRSCFESGLAADLALFTQNQLRFSGALDTVAAVVLCGAHRAHRVMIGGRWVVADGMIPGLDIQALVRRHNAAMHALHAG
jgi:8-oxoguanine deaminase